MEIFQDGELEEEMRKRDYQAHNLSAIWQLFTSSYHEAIQSLTCPVRATYALTDLGEVEFTVQSEATSEGNVQLQIYREDLQLMNSREELLECSLWRPQQARPSFSAALPPCIIYLHGMSSSRKECMYLRDRVLAMGFSLFTMDLSGSGLSEGDRMSFGHFEKDDVRTAVEYLFATNKASRIGIWGRCVGGAAALLYLCDMLDYEYKQLRLPQREALKLQLGECKQTGDILCVRPGRLFRFRMTQLSVTNGDFVVLSIGGRMVKGLDVESCRQLLADCKDTVEIRGYVRRDAPSAAVPVTDQGSPPFVYALALDSTYGDMETVISDMLMEVTKSAEKRNVSFPQTMLSAASKIISRSVRKSAGYQFKDIAVLGSVHALSLPCQFVSVSKVDFIRPEHTRAIYDVYGGEKNWLAFEGDHDQNRPDHVVQAVCSHFDAHWREVSI